jgi:hypothetical protein
MKTDLYLEILEEQWNNIIMLYNTFADIQPIMLYDIQDQKIYAYPHEDYISSLSKKSKAILEKQYTDAIQNNQVIVLIKDNEKRVLKSYTFNID